MKHTAAYTDASASDADKTKMLYDSFEELSAYIVLCGSDKAKYRTLEKGFVNQYLLKNDQYPKTLQDMTDALSKHPFDEEYHARNKRKNEKRNKQKQKEDNGDTPPEPKKATSFAQQTC